MARFALGPAIEAVLEQMKPGEKMRLFEFVKEVTNLRDAQDDGAIYARLTPTDGSHPFPCVVYQDPKFSQKWVVKLIEDKDE